MRSLVWNILVLSLVCFAAGAAAQRDCAAPPQYPHTALFDKHACQQRFGSGRKVSYKCQPDFEYFAGSRFAQCMDGRWTKLTMKCRKKTCGNAGELLYGQYEYEGTTKVGEKAYAVCNKGYTLRGPSYRICKASGWAGEHPTCEEGEPTCQRPAVSNAASGAPAGKDFRVGESVSFTCSEGFRLDGADRITCSEGCRWQPEPPRCLPSPATTTTVTTTTTTVTTPTTTTTVPPAAGSVSATTAAASVQSSTGSDAAAAVQREKEAAKPSAARECGVPPTAASAPDASLASKYVTMTSFSEGYRVHYVCNIGYQQAGGSRYRKCVDGTWTPLQLRCQKKPCGSAGEILNGQFSYTGVEFGDRATAICNKGYRLVGRATRNCVSRGWDGRVPFCEAVDCAEPPIVEGAETEDVEERTYTYGNAVSYSCRVGTLVGPRDVWCTENGTWTTPPTCKQIQCPSPRSPGALWAGGPKQFYTYTDTLTIECPRGYTVTGPNVISCGLDGQWHPQPPSCIRTARPRNWRG